MAEFYLVTIRNIFLSTSLIFSLFTCLIIIIQRLFNYLFTFAIFCIQASYVIMTIIDFVDQFGQVRTQLSCKYTGPFFYAFWLNSSLIISLILFWIIMVLKGKVHVIQKFRNLIFSCFLVISIIVCFAIYSKYSVCGSRDYHFYCGICGGSDNPWEYYYMIGFMYIIPSVIGIGQIIYIKCKYGKSSQFFQLQHTQKLSLRIVYIPSWNIVMLILNLITNILNNFNEFQLFYLIMNQTIFLIPLINFIFFIKFLRKFVELHNFEFKYCGKFLQEDNISQSSYSILFDKNKDDSFTQKC